MNPVSELMAVGLLVVKLQDLGIELIVVANVEVKGCLADNHKSLGHQVGAPGIEFEL
jgi:hypothetical protein